MTSQTDAGPAGPSAEELPRAARRRWWSLSLTGTAAGLLLAGLSTTPSLLPRSPLNQGLAAGIAFGVGYLAAVAALGLVRMLTGGRPRRLVRGVALVLWLCLAGAALVAALPTSSWLRTQNDLRDVYAEPDLGLSDAAAAIGVGVATSAAIVLAGKVLALVFRVVRDRWARRTSRPVAAAASIGVLALAAVVITAVSLAAVGIVFERSAGDYNASEPSWLVEPPGTYRSVGPGSALSWDAAGFEGRTILGTGPSAADITAVTGRPALEPIRVYAGVDEPGGWDEHAAAVVAELTRMNAQDRDVVVVAATTGSGWLDGEAIDAIEYLHDGSTALATMQYSKGESWHSFVFHPGAYREATTALLGAARAWWEALPPDSRPALYAYGLSLGSRAVQDSFPDIAALRGYGDGVVLAGTPYGTALNSSLTAARDAGSPVVVPVLDGGREVRWFADGSAVAESGGEWREPRVVLLQHGTDPIVWAGLPSVWAQPEWLEAGQRSETVHPEMRWIPVVTGIQLMFDTEVDLATPDGAGHRYGYDTVEAWIAVTGDGDHAPDVLDRIRQQVTPRSGAPVGGGV